MDSKGLAMRTMTVVSFGGGVNSTALLVGLYERNLRPDAILFADTQGEKDETYIFLMHLRHWLMCFEFPPLTVVTASPKRKGVVLASLEQECLDSHTLPSKAYGFARCSDKWKIRPQNAWLKAHATGPVTKLIGIDWGEAHRANITEDAHARYEYPLIEWKWDRDACIAAIERAGLPVPPKSACFFCPMSKKHEVLALAKNHHDLFARALAIEDGGSGGDRSIGLGVHWRWRDLVEADRAQLKLFPEPPSTSCVCWDGENDAAH